MVRRVAVTTTTCLAMVAAFLWHEAANPPADQISRLVASLVGG